MNHRIQHRTLLIGLIVIFITGIIFTDSANGQETVITATPLSTVSIFEVPKNPETNLANQNSLQTATTNNTNGDGNGIPGPFPEPEILFEKVCNPTTISLDEEIFCTITIQNNSTKSYAYKVLDLTSHNLSVQDDSVIGAEFHKSNIIIQRGVLAGSTPSSISILKTDTPLAYNSLRELGVPPISNVKDESIINLSTLNPFIFNGEAYDIVGMTSNGYFIAGLGSDEDIAYIPQVFPDSAIPNNVIAPFWTDLNPEAGGNLYAALLTRDNESWVVLEWENVPAFDAVKPSPNCEGVCTNKFTFQAWLKTNTDTQDITFIYPTVDGSGTLSGLNVGAENSDGTVGTNYESLPVTGDELLVVSTPGTGGESHVISYIAEPVRSGNWFSCALIKVFEVRGVDFDCSYGIITE